MPPKILMEMFAPQSVSPVSTGVNIQDPREEGGALDRMDELIALNDLLNSFGISEENQPMAYQSIVDMWEELKNCNDFDLGKGVDGEGKWLEENKWNEGKRIRDLWSDDDIFESVSLDEFVDDVNEVYREKEGFMFKGSWFLSDFVNISEMGIDISLSDNYGEYVEREVDND